MSKITNLPDWTVMVYMIGDNNLTNHCLEDLRQIETAHAAASQTSRERVKVIVEIDRGSKKFADDSQRTPKRYVLGATTQTKSFRSINGGKPKVLETFVQYCLEQHPAQRYLLVLWGHARSLDTQPITEKQILSLTQTARPTPLVAQTPVAVKEGPARPPFFVICPDEGVKKAGGSALTDLDLGTVLANVADARQGKPLVLGLDACIMSALEVCYEVKDSADYVIASQSLVPSSGWPYHKFLARLYDAPEMDEAALCRAAVTEYQEYYNDYDDLPVQLSACRLAHTETVAQAVRELAAMLCDKLASLDLDEFLTIRNALLSAHLAAQHYDEFQFYDLYDFCYMLGEGCRDGKLQERCQAVMQALAGTPDGAEGFVVACASSSTCAALQFSSGVSIYFPWAEVSRRYQFMPFAKATNWHEFLEQYVANTAKLGRRHRVATANGQPAEWKIGALPFKKTADGQTAEWKIGALPFKKATAAENHTANRAGAEAGNWKIGALPFKKAGLSQSGVPHVAIRASAAGPRKQAVTAESLTLQRAGAEAGNWKIGALPFKKAGVSNVIGPQVAIRTPSDKSRKNGSPERRRK